MDDEEWRAYRARLRTRASCYGALTLGPCLIALALLRIAAPITYPDGDPRNGEVWRIGVNGLFILFAAAVIAYAVRWLRRDQRRP